MQNSSNKPWDHVIVVCQLEGVIANGKTKKINPKAMKVFTDAISSLTKDGSQVAVLFYTDRWASPEELTRLDMAPFRQITFPTEKNATEVEDGGDRDDDFDVRYDAPVREQFSELGFVRTTSRCFSVEELIKKRILEYGVCGYVVVTMDAEFSPIGMRDNIVRIDPENNLTKDDVEFILTKAQKGYRVYRLAEIDNGPAKAMQMEVQKLLHVLQTSIFATSMIERVGKNLNIKTQSEIDDDNMILENAVQIMTNEFNSIDELVNNIKNSLTKSYNYQTNRIRVDMAAFARQKK